MLNLYFLINHYVELSLVLSLNNNILIYYLFQHPIFVILLLQILQQLIPFHFDIFQCLHLYFHIIFLFIWIEELHLCCVYLFFFYSYLLYTSCVANYYFNGFAS
jgi:hypothetical protein